MNLLSLPPKWRVAFFVVVATVIALIISIINMPPSWPILGKIAFLLSVVLLGGGGSAFFIGLIVYMSGKQPPTNK